MSRLSLLVLASAGMLLALDVGSALARGPQPQPNPCAAGTLASGAYSGFTVTGTCNVAFGAQVTINGNLTLADGSVFGGLIPSSVHVTGDVKVGNGAQLALGYATRTDVVDGSIVAKQPLSLYLGFVTVHGDVTSRGGGSSARFYNFPIKGNTIDGNLTLRGWIGGWIGAIRNKVGGNVEIVRNLSVVQAADGGACQSTFPAGCDAAPGGDPDSTEIMTNTIAGDLSCHGNSPAAQVNPADGGQPNVVGGTASGECAGLTTASPCATGTLASGTYNGFIVYGACNVAPGAQVTVNGDLTLAPGAVFGGLVPSTVHVTGDVNVGAGAELALGYGTKTDVVDGNITANQPLSLYLGFVTVHGNVTSNGGGSSARFFNFPIKDNTIEGNLILRGWDGGWIGAIRNTVGGNVEVSNNVSSVQAADDNACQSTFPAGCDAVPGTDSDSTEIMTNTIAGNLKCQGNSPPAQVNPADGGQPNVVGGKATGECAGLTTASPCATGTLASGTYNGLTIYGACNVTPGAQVTVNGDLNLAPGSVFGGLVPSTVHVTGDVNVGNGAELALGYGTKADVVDGNITADQPLSLYLGFVTVHGNVTSNGGGSSARFFNFPIKDNTIDGNLILRGWDGGWIGAIRNTVGGNVEVSNNTSVVHPADDNACQSTFPAGCDPAAGGDTDSTEIMTNTIAGNLRCQGNSPPAQVNPADGGQPNVVGGKATGECAGLTTANPCAAGTLASGTYNGLTIYGACNVTPGAQVTVNGDLNLAPGSVFGGLVPSTVHVTGDVNVGPGAELALGYGTKTDVVDGNITANQPLSLYLGFVTVHGNVTSNGGGSSARFFNFPIKDNTIDGNLTMDGWTGGWIGAIRNTVGGSVEVSNNTSVVHAADENACQSTFPAGCDPAAGGDTDSTEIMTNTIAGNLRCQGNTPPAQVNPLDGGQPNVVGGKATGECAGLTTANACATGTLASGTFDGLTIYGTCNVAPGAQVTVNGDLTLTPGSVFGGLVPSTVHVTGNVNVGNGAELALGYGTKADVVDGNITADQPLSLYLGFVTVHGNVTSNGGGSSARFFNFPIKDNTIDGNLTMDGWTGGWIGAIRNTVGGSVEVSNNTSVVHAADENACQSTFPAGCDPAAGGDTDSTEVMTNTIAGNLTCRGNSPAAQVNPADGGQPNVVGGKAKGECAGLTTAGPVALAASGGGSD